MQSIVAVKSDGSVSYQPHCRNYISGAHERSCDYELARQNTRHVDISVPGLAPVCKLFSVWTGSFFVVKSTEAGSLIFCRRSTGSSSQVFAVGSEQNAS